MSLCTTEDAKIHAIYDEMSLKCSKIRRHTLCQSPFAKTVHNKMTFVFLTNAAPDQDGASEIAGASEHVILNI